MKSITIDWKPLFSEFSTSFREKPFTSFQKDTIVTSREAKVLFSSNTQIFTLVVQSTFEFTMGGDRFYMRLEKNKHRIAGIIEKTWI